MSLCNTGNAGNDKNKENRTKQHKVQFHPRTGHKAQNVRICTALFFL